MASAGLRSLNFVCRPSCHHCCCPIVRDDDGDEEEEGEDNDVRLGRIYIVDLRREGGRGRRRKESEPTTNQLVDNGDVHSRGILASAVRPAGRVSPVRLCWPAAKGTKAKKGPVN